MNIIDLSGTWQLYMDYECKDCIPVSYNDEITLPNTTSNSKKGIKNDRRESGYLTEPYNFEGCAWYKKRVEKKPCFCNILVLKTKCYKTRLLNGSYYRIIEPYRVCRRLFI